MDGVWVPCPSRVHYTIHWKFNIKIDITMQHSGDLLMHPSDICVYLYEVSWQHLTMKPFWCVRIWPDFMNMVRLRTFQYFFAWIHRCTEEPKVMREYYVKVIVGGATLLWCPGNSLVYISWALTSGELIKYSYIAHCKMWIITVQNGHYRGWQSERFSEIIGTFEIHTAMMSCALRIPDVLNLFTKKSMI